MIVRNIQIRNNFYSLPDETGSLIGDYCAFGYFDAIVANDPLDFKPVDSGKSRLIWRYVANSNIENLDGTTTIRNILCFADFDPKKESEFWKNARIHPFLILTLIRIETAEKAISPIVNENGAILYYTSVHSDFVALAWGNNYTDCRTKIQSLSKDLAIIKEFSILSVNEDKENTFNRIEMENLGCRFRIAVKKNKEPGSDPIKEYRDLLAKSLETRIDSWAMLGSDDYLLEAKDVPITKLVECYAGGGIMRHENYKEFAYNIETEILISKS